MTSTIREREGLIISCNGNVTLKANSFGSATKLKLVASLLLVSYSPTLIFAINDALLCDNCNVNQQKTC